MDQVLADRVYRSCWPCALRWAAVAWSSRSMAATISARSCTSTSAWTMSLTLSRPIECFRSPSSSSSSSFYRAISLLKKNASLQKNPMPFSRSRFTHKKLDFLFKKVPSRLWKTFDSVPRLCSIYKTHFLKNRCDFMGRKSEMLRCRRFSDQVFYSSHQGSTQINISRIFK